MDKREPHKRGENWSRLPRTDGAKHRPGTLNPIAPVRNPRIKREVDRWVGFVQDAAHRGILPVNVMLDNIEFEHKQIVGMTTEINRLCSDLQDDPGLTADAKAVMVCEVAQMMSALKGARARAQQYAVDLAPFLHPRLASITITASEEEPRVVDLANQIVDLNQDDAAAAYFRIIKGEPPRQEVLPPEEEEVE